LNISIGGPAEKVGLDRDDLIIRFQGKEVGNVDEYVEAVRQLPVHTRVTMEAIHLGQHRTIEFELTPATGEPQWKYPVEAQVEISWGPGTVFRLGPGSDHWIEIPVDSVPNIGDSSMMKGLFTERYVSRQVADGESYTITIEGNPKDANTPVTVHSGQTEYSATVGHISGLPEKYRAGAKEAIENAKRNSEQRLRIGNLSLPKPPDPDVYRKYIENLPMPKLDPNQGSDKRDRVIEKLQGEIEKLQQRLEQMENHIDKKPDRSEKTPVNPAEPNSGTKGTSTPAQKTGARNDEAI
jgi:hypothetical protein